MSETVTGQDAPIEATTPESTQLPVETIGADTDSALVETEAPVEKTFTQKELDEILQKRLAKAEAKSERRATQAYRDALEAVTRSQPAPQQQADKAPSRDQYANDEQWLDARDEYRDAKRDNASRATEQAKSQTQLSDKTESLYAQAAKLDGFDRDAFDDLPLTATLATALVESDVAPQLMAYMASNPDEVDRLAKLSPSRQAAELGKLEMKLQTTKTTKASAPITPIGSKGSAAQALDRMSFAEYKAARAKDGARWAR